MLGVVFRVSIILTLYGLILSTNLWVWVAIPDRCPKKFRAVLSAVRILMALPSIYAATLPALTIAPSLTAGLKINFLSTDLNTASMTPNPQMMPFSLKIIQAFAFLFPNLQRDEVISPRPISSL